MRRPAGNVRLSLTISRGVLASYGAEKAKCTNDIQLSRGRAKDLVHGVKNQCGNLVPTPSLLYEKDVVRERDGRATLALHDIMIVM